jgi:hypothetical protein
MSESTARTEVTAEPTTAPTEVTAAELGLKRPLDESSETNDAEIKKIKSEENDSLFVKLRGLPFQVQLPNESSESVTLTGFRQSRLIHLM